ncbi:MAG: methyltransferase domain-containing protein [Alphaproteobacteria bacterium]|nr:MAG: methyltransferase domain-containing protein [Alphaproteobacteria bacterium]
MPGSCRSIAARECEAGRGAMKTAAVAEHYGSAGIAERVLAALREAKGPDAPVTPDALAPFDHFHGRGVVATQEIAAQLALQPGERVLDIGSGIGGPARWFAATYGVHVTGVDLTPEFCAAAETLNAATGLGDRVTIRNGSALALPVPDGAFDAAYSQNVIMNIADKKQFYREAFRALRPGGRLALSNLCAGPAGEPYFPAPWATTRETSFLASPDEMRADLIAAGFEIAEFRDITEAMREVQRRTRERLDKGDMPKVAVDIIMGERAREMQRNSIRTIEDGRGIAIEALVRKPG